MSRRAWSATFSNKLLAKPHDKKDLDNKDIDLPGELSMYAISQKLLPSMTHKLKYISNQVFFKKYQ